MKETVSPAPVSVGEIIAGKYRVERVLGRGGTGEVFAARHKDLGSLFAIKVLAPRAADDPQAVERFLREARAVAALQGEHIAKVTDVGRLDSGSPYIVMEHLVGTDLRKHLDARGPLSVADAIAHVLDACEAIAEAHSLGIFHRDLKPSNLFLIRRANGTSSIKVLDIGISKHVAPEAVDVTGGGEVAGSPLYMAPEQISRKTALDARCDVWSMGIVLYELLTGTTPFDSTMMTEVIARILQEDASPPSKVRADLPSRVDAIVLKCLQKRPEKRYQTIAELTAALRALCDPATVRAPRPITGADLAPRSNSRIILSPSVSATLDPSAMDVAVGAASTPDAFSRPPRGRNASTAAETVLIRVPKKRAAVRSWVLGGAVIALVAVFGIWLVGRPSPGGSVAAFVAQIKAAPALAEPDLSAAPAAEPPPAAASAAPAIEPPSAATSSPEPAAPPNSAAAGESSAAPVATAVKPSRTARPAIKKPAVARPAAGKSPKVGGIH